MFVIFKNVDILLFCNFTLVITFHITKYIVILLLNCTTCYEGRDYQPYLTTTLPSSARDSNTEDCGESL